MHSLHWFMVCIVARINTTACNQQGTMMEQTLFCIWLVEILVCIAGGRPAARNPMLMSCWRAQ